MSTFSQTLTQYATICALSDRGMAQLLGVPLTTYRHWTTCTRSPDRAALRLLSVLVQIQHHAPDLHASLIAEARLLAPAVTRGRGRPRKLVQVPSVADGVADDGAQAHQTGPGAATEGEQAPEVPNWLCASPESI